MTIHNISPDSVAMFIASAELEKEGLDVESLDVESAARLAREAFKTAGIAVATGLEIEAFAGTCGILVFAQLLTALPVVYKFDDFEDMLRGIGTVPPEVRGDVFAMEDSWWLRITEGWDKAPALTEFGRKIPDAGTEAALTERGAKVFSCGSLRNFAAAVTTGRFLS